jgi:hypothetical protein
MALGISTESGGGDYLPIIKFDSRAGRLFRVDRSQGANGWESDQVDITGNASFVADLENISVGWMLFAAGGRPDFKMARLGAPRPARPSQEYREGFKLIVKLAKDCGGDVREIASNAKAVIGAIDLLHTKYEEGAKTNPGKLPVVKLTGSRPIKTTTPQGSTTNYAPVFEIVKWVARPADLPAGEAPVPTVAAPSTVPAETGSKTMAAPQPATVSEDSDDFG